MKLNHPSSALDVLTETAEGLLDIFVIGASALEDHSPESDVRNLHSDLEQISGDFRRVMSEIDAGSFSE